MGRAALHIFVKAPRPGLVKTRLAKTRGPEFASRLYEAFLADLRGLSAEPGLLVRVRVTPDDAVGEMKARFPEAEVVPQGDGNLGCRLKRAFEERQGAAVAVGSDSPTLECAEILAAADRLVQGESSAVIQPATDGGYVLIGFADGSYGPEVFEGVEWSTERVFRETLERMEQLGIRPEVLEEGYDVDLESDLERLARELGDHPERARQTADFLLESGLLERRAP